MLIDKIFAFLKAAMLFFAYQFGKNNEAQSVEAYTNRARAVRDEDIIKGERAINAKINDLENTIPDTPWSDGVH